MTTGHHGLGEAIDCTQPKPQPGAPSARCAALVAGPAPLWMNTTRTHHAARLS
jgi:hypothetical protein